MGLGVGGDGEFPARDWLDPQSEGEEEATNAGTSNNAGPGAS